MENDSKNINALFSLLPKEGDAEFGKGNLLKMKALLNRRRNMRYLRHFLYSAAASIAILLSAFTLFRSEDKAQKPMVITSSVSFHEVSTGAGEIRRIILDDGTTIWLNGMSSIRYPKHFSNNANNVRKVELIEGEIFLDVTHNPKLPFILSTCDMDIRVLGTKFNVSAYAHHNTKATLIEGSIRAYPSNNSAEGVTIKPNESIEMRESELVRSKADEKGCVLWTKGIYAFEDATFEEIASKLELYYGVTINIADSTIANRRYSGKFRNESDITVIFEAMRRATDFEYGYEAENKIDIY